VNFFLAQSEGHSLPLRGRKFLVARSSEGNEEERKKLEALGANTVELATIEISPPTSWNAVDRAIERIQDFDWIAFTSANGVRFFFERFKNTSHPAKIKAKFACVGPSTQEALQKLGFAASLVPAEFLTEKLGEDLSELGIGGKKVLLARAEVANKKLAEILRANGAVVVEAPVYTTVSARGVQPSKNLLDGVSDITLTSPSAVEGLLSLIERKDIISRGIGIHCIGPVTSKKALDLGLRVSTTAHVHTIDGLIDAIVAQSATNGRMAA
jgi:uroporphyrinogen III methyltransferase / synthase